ncbi:MAG: hypothetical protein ACOVP8_13475 [Phycisphaerales bacterium]|jgi:hypothetical protein
MTDTEGARQLIKPDVLGSTAIKPAEVLDWCGITRIGGVHIRSEEARRRRLS